jgi:predicted DNA-binding WGR domain protein
LLELAGGHEGPAEEIEVDSAFEEALEARLEEAAESARGNGDAEGRAADEGSVPSTSVLELHDGQSRYFEYVGGVSRKFWEITLSGDRFSVCFGRIGTAGQEQAKSFPDAAAARRAAERMVSEKLGKGYEEKPKPGTPKT